MTDDQIKHMAERFLSWKLPANFNPDCGISFKAALKEHTAHPSKHEPTGTNLFGYTDAVAMVRFMAEGMHSPAPGLSEENHSADSALRAEIWQPVPGKPRDGNNG
jgi:hypothetical protein